MADIQQWRRMIQPTRTRTVALEQDDADAFASPVTPKRGIGPKLSSYFGQHTGPGPVVKPETSFASLDGEIFGSRVSYEPDEAPFPESKAEPLIDSILCRLMSAPYEPLDVRFNGVLLQIFERFRTLDDEKQQLQARVSDGGHSLVGMEQRLRQAQKRWVEERQGYKAEIGRLEQLLHANSKRSFADVSLTHHGSAALRRQSEQRAGEADDGLETIFELLEKTKRCEDRAWSSQRATFRTRASSPSAQMRRLSKQLVSKSSMTSIHVDLPFGTPPDAMPSTLAEASLLEQQAERGLDLRAEAGLHSPSEPRNSFSDETFSTFSFAGDVWSDANADTEAAECTGDENELFAIKRIATVLARRRHINPDEVMPKLLDLCSVLSSDGTPFAGKTNADGNRHGPLEVATMVSMTPVTTVRKQPSLMAKASGFFHRLKTHSAVDHVVEDRHRFSFDVGDDVVALSTPVGRGEANEGSLRKSVSLSDLSRMSQQRDAMPQRNPFPLPTTPTTAAPPVEARRMSRIPTPVHGSGGLARPRQEREDSSSSLLTVINHDKRNSHRCGSTGSSTYSSPGTCVDGFGPHGSDRAASGTQTSASSSNMLLEYTQALRASSFTTAVAKSGSNGCSSSCDHHFADQSKRISTQSSYSGLCTLGLSTETNDIGKENVQPNHCAGDGYPLSDEEEEEDLLCFEASSDPWRRY